MVEPKYPYPTWLLDDDALGVRSYGALMAHHGINGFVYSMAHGWGPKPLEVLLSFAGTNGDGTLLYPSEIVDPESSGPLPSLRLMLLRDAIEDYELLRVLPRETQLDLTRSVLDERSPLLLLKRDPHQWEKFRALLLAAVARRQKTAATAGRETLQHLKGQGRREGVTGLTIPGVATTPVVDGNIDDSAWSANTRFFGDLLRYAGSPHETYGTQAWVTHDADYLYVAVRAAFPPLPGRRTAAPGPQRPIPADFMVPAGDWIAVDLAPLSGRERWRFVVTPHGTYVVERHTREGQFKIEGLEWKHGTRIGGKDYSVEFRIPLELVGDGTSFRLNVLRRIGSRDLSPRYFVRAYPDAGDVTLMPVVQLQSRSGQL
jgi:hypothetical protein